MLTQHPERCSPAWRFQPIGHDGDVEWYIPRPFEICGGPVWVVRGGHGIPEHGGGQEGVPPVTTHVGYGDAVAVAGKEGWYYGKGLWWKMLVDGGKSVQDEADGRV